MVDVAPGSPTARWFAYARIGGDSVNDLAFKEEPVADAKPTQKTGPTQLARASESSDPAVHQLLAQRQTAHMNEDTDGLTRINRELADLGYE